MIMTLDASHIQILWVAHDKIQPAYEYYESSIVDRSIPKNATTKALKALVDTLNFIDIWIKLFVDNYEARFEAYTNYMKDMFKKIPQTMIKALTPQQKSRNVWQILVVDGIWKK